MPTVSLQQALEMAAAHHRSGQLEQAEAIYRHILIHHPNHPDALHLLGVSQGQRGKYDDAIALIQQAISIDSSRATYHSNLAEALRAKGDLNLAVAAWKRVHQLNPRDVDTLFKLSVAYEQLGDLDQAIAACRSVIAIEPNHIGAQANLGTLLGKSGKLEQSIAALKRAIELGGDNAEIWCNLGMALFKAGEVEQSIFAHHRAIKARPDYAPAYNNLSVVLDRSGSLDEALAACRRALEIQPDFIDALCNLSLILFNNGDFDSALTTCQRVLQRMPDNAQAHSNLSVILEGLGQTDQAIATAQKAIKLQPDLADAHYKLATFLLKRGQFAEGWKEFEWREHYSTAARIAGYPQPKWKGEPIGGKTILLHAEQGLGDAIQFLRYVPDVIRTGAKVKLACPKELLGLLSTSLDRSVEISEVIPVNSFDVHCPLMSLAGIFHTDYADIPAEIPYLRPDAKLIESMRQRIKSSGGRPKIGLVWAGNPKFRHYARKAIPFPMLAALASCDVEWHSLQKGPRASDLSSAPPGLSVIDHSDHLPDLGHTAALIQNLDLVISIDTAVAHLAGAMGKPVWALLPWYADWRWFENRDDSPWYPTMRLFRQDVPGDWPGVLHRVIKALSQSFGRFARQPPPLTRDQLIPRVQRAMALQDRGEVDQAIAVWNESIEMAPDCADLYAFLACAWEKKKNWDNVIASSRQAVEINPQLAEAYSALAVGLQGKGDLDQAIALGRKAIELKPALAEAYLNLNTALEERGDADEALATCRQAIRLQPESANAHWNLSLLLLRRGQLAQGWVEYDWRQHESMGIVAHRFPQPQWTGGDISGKSILLHTEQGLGDSIQFARYVPMLAQRGARMTLLCQDVLQRLFCDNLGAYAKVDQSAMGPFDFQCPLLSLPRAFGTDLSTIPADVPYLQARPDLIQSWNERLGRSPHDRRLHIGLAWAGSPDHPRDAHRSIDISTLARLTESDAVWHSLQKKRAEEGVARAADSLKIIDHSGDLADFTDTAALIQNLDLVISVDTAIAHLAGAMGKPTWVLLPFYSDWRWMFDRPDSPWYPTMRLFRQSIRGRWEEPIQNVLSALNDWIEKKRPTSR